ncbi:MAG: enoyl-CoA hydratase [Actinomycetota bacterium]|nr:enoyl-CoA hydratase [Actinomycetota bacterium]
MIQIDRGAVAVVTIDRPEVRNALDIPTLLELETAFAALEGDDGVRAIVVTGAGDRAFVAGGDIGDLNSRQGLAHYREFAEVIHRVFRRVERCPKPTVGAVRGYALGGGVELLLALDIRILGTSAKLGVPEITLGLFPGAGGTQRLIRQIPLCRAKELMMTGDPISAEEAVAIGLANRVVSDEDVVAAAREVAERIAQRSPLVLSMLKRTLAEGAEMPPSAALAFEQAMIGLVLDSADAHEGCSAFLERRPPQFTGS